MQEEVEQKSLTLTVNAAKMTARLFRAAIAKYVAHKKEKKHDAQTGVRYVGRQSVKKLVGQNQGVSNVELSGEDIKAFERVARKYGVDYAVKKVKGDAPRFLIFFKAREKTYASGIQTNGYSLVRSWFIAQFPLYRKDPLFYLTGEHTVLSAKDFLETQEAMKQSA